MEGARPGGRRTRKNKRAAPKKLGRKAQAGIYHNDDEVEKYIDALESGRPLFYEVGVAEANPMNAVHPGKFEFGDGSFSIRVADGYVRAILKGHVRTPGAVHKKEGVPTAINEGSVVLVEPLSFRVGVSTYRVVGVPTADQLDRISGRRSSRKSSSSNVISRKRRSSSLRREAEARMATVATLPFLVKSARRKTNAAAGGAGAEPVLDE